MKAFTFVRPATVDEAAKAAAVKGSVLKAGGIDLLDRMKERVDEPDRVVWLGNVQIGIPPIALAVAPREDQLVIAASATLAEIAASPEVNRGHSALAEAAGLAASPQIRRMATIAGNLSQHSRCGYYRHRSFACMKRGDDRCAVLADGAVQDNAAIFDNRFCASAHPSSLAPVLCAYRAQMNVATPDGKSWDLLIPKQFAPPRRGVAADIALPEGGVITAINIPISAARAAYEEVRQKAAFDWALVSGCVRLEMDGDKVRVADVWLGSVAPAPWRAKAGEDYLVGKSLNEYTIRAAAEAAVTGATPLPGNAYKVDLVKVVVRRALERLRSAK